MLIYSFIGRTSQFLHYINHAIQFSHYITNNVYTRGVFFRCARCEAHSQYKIIPNMCLQTHDLIVQEGFYLLFSNTSAQLWCAWTRGVGRAGLSQSATYKCYYRFGGD
jgi:hypothetical protein